MEDIFLGRDFTTREGLRKKMNPKRMNSEQWQELCEWAGFEREIVDEGEYTHCCAVWHRDDNEVIYSELPSQDMNTIFCWFWPKLTIHQRMEIYDDCRVEIINCDNPFQALVEAIWKVAEYAT